MERGILPNEDAQSSLGKINTPWPPKNGLTTHIVPRQNTILPTSAQIHIDAPATLIWSVLRNTSDYPTWNSFCPSVIIHSQPENVASNEAHNLCLQTSFTFNVIMDSSKPKKVTPTQLRVTDFSTPEEKSSYISSAILDNDGSFEPDLDKVHRIAWTTEGGFVARGLKSERFHEIIDHGDGKGCDVRTWECQGGVLARAVKYYYKDILKTKFEEWCADLKRESERRYKEEERQ